MITTMKANQVCVFQFSLAMLHTAHHKPPTQMLAIAVSVQGEFGHFRNPGTRNQEGEEASAFIKAK